MEKTIYVYGKEFETKDGSKKFVKYSTCDKNGVYHDVHFSRACETTPKEIGGYEIVFNEEDAFVSTDKVHPEWRPTLVITKVISLTKKARANTLDNF